MGRFTVIANTRRDNGTIRLTGASTQLSDKLPRLLRHDQHPDHIFPVISVTSLGRAVFTALEAAHQRAQLQILHSHAGTGCPHRWAEPPERQWLKRANSWCRSREALLHRKEHP